MSVRAKFPFRYDNQLGNEHGRWYVRGNPVRVHPTDANVVAKFNTVFLAACESAGVKPTRRQASKYLNGRGLAFAHRPTNN